MRRIHVALVLSSLLLASLAGCGTSPKTIQTAALGENLAASIPVLPRTNKGSLSIYVRWPKLDLPGFSAKAIPVTTRLLRVTVSNISDQEVARADVPRPSDAAESQVRLELDEGTGLQVQVQAYDADSKLIAQGNASNVQILSNKDTTVPVTLTATYVPTITRLSSNSGLVGNQLVITGTNFGSGAEPVKVRFNGVEASDLTRTSSTSLALTVPAGALTGLVEVEVNAIPSSTTAVFWVIQQGSSLTVSPANSTIDTQESQLFSLDSSQLTYALKSGESATIYSGAPEALWTSSNAALGTLSNSGLFTAGSATGTTDISITVGPITSNTAVLNVKLPAPAIQTLDQSQGLATKPTTITITGSNFQEGSSVTVGATPAADVAVIDSSTIRLTVPAGLAPGGYDIIVTTPDGQTARKVSSFTVKPGVTNVTIDPNTFEINTPARDGTSQAGFPTAVQLAATATLSDSTTSTAFTWKSSDKAKANVSDSGLVTAVQGASAGTITVTATSTIDPAFSAQATIVVATKGRAVVFIN